MTSDGAGHSVSIYVPTGAHKYLDDIREEDSKAVLEYVKRVISKTLGGYTAYPAQGGWVNDNDELVEEPVTVVRSLSTDKSLEKLEELAAELSFEVAVELHQACVLYTVETVKRISFISPDSNYNA